jgi:hypothetical protein
MFIVGFVAAQGEGARRVGRRRGLQVYVHTLAWCFGGSWLGKPLTSKRMRIRASEALSLAPHLLDNLLLQR